MRFSKELKWLAVIGLCLSSMTLLAQETAVYIVKFQEASLVQQLGGVSNTATTRTAANGRKKFDVKSPMAQQALNQLHQVQDQHLQTIEEAVGRNIPMMFRYDAALNGMALELSAAEAGQVAGLPGILWIEEEKIYSLDTDRGPEFIGAHEIWSGAASHNAIGNMGEGTIIGVIDTGINTDHPSFAATGSDGFTVTNPLGSGNFLGDCNPGGQGDQVVCNDKLIGAWGFVGGAVGGPEDTDGHGSHTASTSGGNIVDGPFIDENGQLFDVSGISGVAPHANVISYAGCCGGAALVGSINQSILDGVDALNYSIGPTAGGRGISPWAEATDRGFLDALGAGIFVAASAGNTRTGTNDNPEADVSHRGPWIMTVANSSHDRINKNAVSITAPAPVPADGVTDLYGLVGSGPAFPADIVDPMVAASDVDAANFEGCNAWAGTPFTGSIALISRGGCSFEDKVNNASAAGATAVVVFNNASPVPIVMGALETTTIPSLMVGSTDGAALETYIGNNPGPTAMLDDESFVTLEPLAGNILAGGSLVGPNLDFDLTKPSINGPGTNIFAAVANDPDGIFGFKSGTSMSSPHLAGSGALMIAEHPDWSIMEIKSALMMTADTDVKAADGVSAATPDLVGSGTVDLTKASLAGLVMDESFANMLAADPATGGDPSTVNVPSTRSTSCSPTCSWTRIVRNALPMQALWNASGSGDGFTVSVSPSSFELLPGDVLFMDGAEVSAGPVSSVQILTITASSVSSGNLMAFGEVLLEEDGGLSPDERITVSVSESVPIAPPI